jgi:hypothetical protein
MGAAPLSPIEQRIAAALAAALVREMRQAEPTPAPGDGPWRVVVQDQAPVVVLPRRRLG